MQNSGFSYNSFSNDPKPRKPRPTPIERGAIPSLDRFADKQEAEKMNELNILYSLFPQDPAIRKAAEKSRKKNTLA